MRSRIYEHLKQTAEPLAADRLLGDALSIRSPNRRAADAIVRAIVGADRRFSRTRAGLWKIAGRAAAAARDLQGAAVIHLESSARGSTPPVVRGAVRIEESGRTWELALGAAPSADARRTLAEAHAALEGRLSVVWSAAELATWRRIAARTGLAPHEGDVVALRKLASRALDLPERRIEPADLAGPLGLPIPDPDRPAAIARFFAAAFAALVARVPAEHRCAAGLARWIEAGRAKVEFGRFAFGPELLQDLPETSGVYLFRDRAGRAFYVGKARSLASRVRSYFRPRALADPKVARIHAELHRLEWIETESEVEALLLEMKLIRDLAPAVNLQTEVHEAEAPYGKERNLILLVPDAGGEKARAYLLRRGLFTRSMLVKLGKPPSTALHAAVRRTYFEEGPSRARNRAELEIVSRWLAANRARINLVDVDAAGEFSEVVRILEAYLRDSDRLAKKVYYR